MLEKTNLPIAMSQGLDTKSDPKQLAPGKMTVLENAVLLKTGEVRKVNGYDEYTISNNSRSIGSLKENIFFLTDDQAYTYSFGINKYANVGRYGNFKIEKLAAINQNASNPCTAYDPSNNTVMNVWAENDGLGNYTTKYMVMYAKTNTILKQETVISTFAAKPQVVTGYGMDYFLIVYEDQNTLELKAVVIDKVNWAIQSTVVLATGITNYSGYGFSLIADQTEVNPKTAYICWSCGSLPGAADSRIAVFSATYSGFTAPTSVLLSGLTSRWGSAISFYQSDIMFAFNDRTSIKTVVYNSTLTSLVAASRTVMTTSGTQTFSGVVIGDSATSSIKHVFTTTLTSAGALISQQPKIEQAIVTSTTTVTAQRVFLQGGGLGGTTLVFTESSAKKGYLPIKMIQQFDQNATGGYSGVYTLYLIEYFNENVSATPPNLYVAAKFYDLNATQIYTTSSGGHPDYIFFVAGRWTTKAASFGQAFFGLVKEYAGNSSMCVISKAGQTIMAELANNLHVTGGYLGMFDGVAFAEHNFFQYPLQIYATNIHSGAIGAGTYYYRAIYVWQDAYGQIHQSGVSNPTSIVLSGSTNQVQLEVSTLKLTNKTSNVYIEIYRSNDGVNYYKLAGGIGSLQLNDKTVPTITYIDNTSQPDIISNPLLYTVGGELNNFAAPACTYVSVYKRRLIVAPSEDSNSFWYSKDIIPATAGAIGTPVSFAAEFVVSVDERGGPVTATVQLDDKLVIFKNNSLSIMVGEGPANNGAQNDFTTPQLVVSDTGCLYGRSVVIMPMGVMFQSPKGFYICDRSLSVSYLGAAVENYNGIECTSGNLKFDKNEVWLGLDNGNALVFNYYFSQWSTVAWTTSDITVLQINTQVGSNNAQLRNLLASVNSNKINFESTGYRKNTAGYSLKFTTGWLSFAQVQGFQRVYKLLILGEYKSPHRLQIEVSYDFIDTVTQTTVIDVPSSPTPYEYRVFLTRQKCTAIKFTIKDLTPTVGDWDEGFALSNLALEVGVKRNLNKLSAAKSVG